MFIRFVTDEPDPDTGLPSCVFAAAYQLLREDSTPEYLRLEIRSTLDWFVKNLPVPKRFCRSRKPNRSDNGICWFKADATQCVSHVCYLVYLVSECGIAVREVRTKQPGYAIYEDESQVVTQPFASTPR